MPVILLIGEDELLLDSRAAVLRTIGVNTLCCNTSTALPVLETRHCDLVILCHSVPSHVCETLVSIIHDRWPGTRLLLISPIRAWEGVDSTGLIDAVIPPDPTRLIQRSVELLGPRGMAHADSPSALPSDSGLRLIR